MYSGKSIQLSRADVCRSCLNQLYKLVIKIERLNPIQQSAEGVGQQHASPPLVIGLPMLSALLRQSTNGPSSAAVCLTSAGICPVSVLRLTTTAPLPPPLRHHRRRRAANPHRWAICRLCSSAPNGPEPPRSLAAETR